MEEFTPNPPIKAHTARHIMHIRTDFFTKIGDFIDEGDLGREEGIGGVFNQLRRFQRCRQYGRFNQIERAIEPLQHGEPLIILNPNDHAVRAHEITNRAAFPQKFRVGGNADGKFWPHALHNGAHFPPGADRHGGFRHQHQGAGRGARHFLGCGINIGKISMAIAAPGWRADREENGIRPGDGGLQIGGEAKPASSDIFRNQLIQPRFIDRHAPFMQRGDLGGINIHHRYIHAEFGEAGAGYQADIAGPDHGDAHGVLLRFEARLQWRGQPGLARGSAGDKALSAMGQQGAQAFQITLGPADQIARRCSIRVQRQRCQADVTVNAE